MFIFYNIVTFLSINGLKEIIEEQKEVMQWRDIPLGIWFKVTDTGFEFIITRKDKSGETLKSSYANFLIVGSDPFSLSIKKYNIYLRLKGLKESESARRSYFGNDLNFYK